MLLVIFMTVLPLSQQGLDVNLPSEVSNPTAPPPDGQIVLEYTADRSMSINNRDVSGAELPERLRAIFQERRDKTLFTVGDGGLRYRDIVQVIESARGAGVDKVGVSPTHCVVRLPMIRCDARG